MKKGIFLLTSLLLTATAGTSVLTQQNKTQNNANVQETTKSLDIIDLTMPWWGSTAAETPNLTELLNTNAGRFLNQSSMILTASNGTEINATSDFDNSGLRSILLLNSVHINKVELKVSSTDSYSNYVMAYYSYWEPTENQEKQSSKVINRFNWSGIDMTPFWTENVNLEFELSF